MKQTIHESKLTAYALGETSLSETEEIQKYLAENPQAQKEVESIQRAASQLKAHFSGQQVPEFKLSREQRQTILNKSQPQSSWLEKLSANWKVLTPGLSFAIALTFFLTVYDLEDFMRSHLEGPDVAFVPTTTYSEEELKPYSFDPNEKPYGYQGPAARPQKDFLLAEGGSRSDRRAGIGGKDPSAGARKGNLSAFGKEKVKRLNPAPYGRGDTIGTQFKEGHTGYWHSLRTGESYKHYLENSFVAVVKEPLSTFSMDVNTASYANMRRLLINSDPLPADAIRIEELINYFHYSYPKPSDGKTFAVHVESAMSPWNKDNLLVRVGLKGKEIQTHERLPSNLVFLVDVSGSMYDADKLPLVKKSLMLLTEQLGENDKIAIVTYSGSSEVILPSTRGNKKGTIKKAIDSLSVEGATNGAAGIKDAYRIAQESFLKDGVNRIIMATDGDFNVGLRSDEDMGKLVEEKRKSGVFLSVLGFGTGNYQDSKMSEMATKGNGNYAYIDTVREARRVLVQQMQGTLQVIAKDVKAQVEFNPKFVSRYRLIGYEKGILAAEDFADDKKDAGEVGSGHTVTALYEVVLVENEKHKIPKLKYQQVEAPVLNAYDELLTVKVRFKQPQGTESELIEVPFRADGKKFEDASRDFQFAGAVAAFGMLLKDSTFKGDLTYAKVLKMGETAERDSTDEYKHEFLELVKKAQAMSPEK